MKYILTALLFCTSNLYAQTYTDSINKFRQHYKQEFITDERSPLKGNDTAFLRFFAPDKKYRVIADFSVTPSSEIFEMPTYSGKTKKFKQYGVARFIINDTILSLSVYQNQKLLEDPKYKNHLFIPFTDGTSYSETYAGGRYIDMETTDVVNGKITIDFNKCYNPYCAYADGYNCPVPPVENRLPISIRAGEKIFGKEHK
ncbi:MAG: DUF1684 domain-containing protein [Bacteroidetes bacterium]|nr:DUF1684 domain-containing protein [Bacteroidota bacterium]